MLLVSPGVWADDPTNKPAIKASWVRESVRTPVPSNRLILTMGTNQFAFILPGDFQLQKDPAGNRVVLPQVSGHCSLTFSLLPVDPTNAANPMVSAELQPRRAAWLAQFAQAQIVNEIGRGMGNALGQGFIMRWPTVGLQWEYRGVLYAPYAGNLLEVTFSAGQEHYQEAYEIFNLLTATFSAGETGKLEIQPLSDKL